MAKDVAMPNDVGQWGDKDVRGMYSGPSVIAGEKVDWDTLPEFGENGQGAPDGVDAVEPPAPKVPVAPAPGGA